MGGVKPPLPQFIDNPGLSKDLPRFMNYVADYGGCGFWRVIWPEYILNASNKCMVHTSTCMTLDPQHYRNTKALKIQRQASHDHLKFAQH